MTEVLCRALLGYLLGTLLGGRIAGALRGIDLRTVGSGNVGATNALRAKGPAFALLVLAIDIGKGVAAVLLVPLLPWPWAGDGSVPPALPADALPYLCGAACVLGHCYPFWTGFTGGKGVATLAGVFAVLLPVTFGWMIAGFAFVVLATGWVSLASVSAGVVALFHVTCFDERGIFSPAGAFCAAMLALVVFTHRANLVRLAQGKEHRFEKAALLRRLWTRG